MVIPVLHLGMFVYAGCGCVLAYVCVCVKASLLFDTLNSFRCAGFGRFVKLFEL